MSVTLVDLIGFRWRKRRERRGDMGGRPHGSRTVEGQLIGAEMRGKDKIEYSRGGKEVKNTKL